MISIIIAATTVAPAAVEPFAIGATTEQIVMERLGKPNSTTAMGDGTRILVYVSSKTRVKGASYVPIVGLFAGGAKSHVVVRTFSFGPDGVLRNYSTTDTSADCNVGLFNAGCH